MSDVDIWPLVSQHPWKYRKRTKPIRILLVHATRGGQGHPTETEFSAFTNWEISPYNRIVTPDEVYGSMASVGIGAGGRLVTVVPDAYYPAYSAGHMDPEAKSYEVCQSNADQPYDPRDIDRLVDELAKDCIRYGIPPRFEFMSGDNHEAPAITRHDTSANGHKWGKSDPGYLFPQADVERRVAAIVNGEGEDMAERIWCAERFQTWILGKGGAAPVVYPADDAIWQSLYGPHTRVLTAAQLEALRPR